MNLNHHYNCVPKMIITFQMIKSQIWKDLTRKKEKWKCRYKYINLWGRTLWYMNIFLTRACKFSLILRQLFSKHKLWHFICISNIIRQQQQKIFLKYSHEYWDNVLFILILLWFCRLYCIKFPSFQFHYNWKYFKDKPIKYQYEK